MKKLFSLLLFMVALYIGAKAQDCGQFVNNVNGKKLTYINQDAKGNPQMTAIYTSTKKDASTISVHSEIIDKTGKSIGAGDSEMICDGNNIRIDMKSFIPVASLRQNMNIKMDGEAKYLTFPAGMQPGQSLEDATVTLDIDNGGMQVTMQMDFVNRKVEQAETITTNAGSFDCLKITYEATTKMKIAGIGIPFHMKITEWFCPRLGRDVKSETYNKGGKLMGTMMLDSIK
jgi:hypothetical protein